jgi:hypothetical protein
MVGKKNKIHFDSHAYQNMKENKINEIRRCAYKNKNPTQILLFLNVIDVQIEKVSIYNNIILK